MVAAIDLGDNTSGRDVELDEKPQNLVEMKPSAGMNSPFLLRLIHLRQNSIPSSIEVIFIWPNINDIIFHPI